MAYWVEYYEGWESGETLKRRVHETAENYVETLGDNGRLQFFDKYKKLVAAYRADAVFCFGIELEEPE